MRQFILSFLALFFLITAISAQSNFKTEHLKFRKVLNKKFKNKKKSPLPYSDIKAFKQLDFFDADKNFKVTAKFLKSESKKTIKMKTSSESLPFYDIYGVITFTIHGNNYTLNIYQSHRSKASEKYKNHLFLPFTDLTNGVETYAGGRYIDLKIPDSDSIIIDFNKAYNPYCAYSHRYSCPIPPAENNLKIRIEAGVKAYKAKP